MFAADQLGVNRYYTEQETGNNYQVPTQLGYLKYNAKTLIDKMSYLKLGANVNVTNQRGDSANYDLPGPYPKLTSRIAEENKVKERTKNDKFFGYPLQ